MWLDAEANQYTAWLHDSELMLLSLKNMLITLMKTLPRFKLQNLIEAVQQTLF